MDEIPRILVWVLVGSATVTLLAVLFRLPEARSSDRLAIWGTLLASDVAFRAMARAAWRRLTPAERVVLIGNGSLALAAHRKFDLFSDMHVRVVRQLPTLHSHDLEQPEPAWLAGADRVVLALPAVSESVLAALLPHCRRHQVKLSVVPPARGLLGTAVQLDHVAELPVIEYHTWDVGRTTLLGKRVLDIIGSITGLLVLSPLLATAVVVIRLTSRGAAVFSQVRAGRDGRPFRMFKLRTMTVDAEEELASLLDLDELEEPAFKLERDPRVTRVGHFLRRWSIDELPQLWNVLRGDMSLVGPRPEQVELVERYAPEHRFRLIPKPGMTGPMQVYGRGRLSFDERLAVERDYVEQPSLSRDLRLIALTVAAVVRGRGAY